MPVANAVPANRKTHTRPVMDVACREFKNKARPVGSALTRFDDLTTAGVQLLAAHRSIRNGDRMPKPNAGKRLKNNLHERFTEPRRDAVRLPNERF